MDDLLERQSELRALDSALAAARAGQGRFVLISGEAGIGKTALVGHALRDRGDSVTLLRGYCDPILTPSALGPLHDICRGLGTDLLRHGDGAGGMGFVFDRLLGLLLGCANRRSL